MDEIAASWSWNESVRPESLRDPERYSRSQPADVEGVESQHHAASAESWIGWIDSAQDRFGKIPREATDRPFSLRRVEDVRFTQRKSSDTCGARRGLGPAMTTLDWTADGGSTKGSVPAKVTDRSSSVKEDNKAIHSRLIIADWDWDPDEDPASYEVPEFHPWSRGRDGKGLISPDGQLLTWVTNAMGEPHHDVVSAERNFPYAAKTTIYPSGQTFIPSPDELHLNGMDRDEAEAHLAREAPKHGLTFVAGFRAKTAAQPQVMYHVAMGEWGPDGELVSDYERPPAILYHRAPKDNREAIAANGLRAAGDPEVDPQPAVFMTRQNPVQVHAEGPGSTHYNPDQHDVYEVDVRGLPIRYDPWGEMNGADEIAYGQYGGSLYHPGDIPPERIRRIAKAKTCPTCGDPLKGEYGTFCSRCQWSEHEPNLDSDPLSNPPDPTKELHRGIQSAFGWYDAIEETP